MSDAEIILNIENLTVAYRHGGVWQDAVRDISLRVHAGETYGLVGESGSGKTTLLLAIMRYLGEKGSVRQGKIELEGRDLLSLTQKQMLDVWGKQITFVPQNPQSSLNPALKVGEQLSEILRHHLDLDNETARRRTIELFSMVDLADPTRVADSYPHQISGGMQQRVMIAMALSTEPLLLVLDEPTTSLDVTTQAVILDLVLELIQGRKTAALYVTHNLGVVAQFCDRVGVLYAGDLVEEAASDDLFTKPLHPYTQGLLDSVPRLGETKSQIQLRGIQGQIPYLGERPDGCLFETRCPLAIEVCSQRPIWSGTEERRVRCHRWQEIDRDEVDASQPIQEATRVEARVEQDQDPVLNMDGVRVYFPLRRSLSEILRRAPKTVLRAVDGVNLEVMRGQTLGLVGESGSGKTTLARTIVGLVEKTQGSIDLLSIPLAAELEDRDLETLRHMQMVFQNPEGALNPYLTVGETLRRTLMTLLGNNRSMAEQKLIQLLKAVRLAPSYKDRLPGQLSGGEKQRVAIARAFASNPELLICDEPVSSLDVSVQASILNLLNDIQFEHGISLLFISHDLAVVGYLADLVAVIYLGQLMEIAQAKSLFEPPYCPYTEALLSAIPTVDTEFKQKPIRLKGEIPSPIDIPSGCPFHTRCPHYLGEICAQEKPPWQVVPETGKLYYCHIPPQKLLQVQERVVLQKDR